MARQTARLVLKLLGEISDFGPPGAAAEIQNPLTGLAFQFVRGRAKVAGVLNIKKAMLKNWAKRGERRMLTLTLKKHIFRKPVPAG